MVNEERLKKIEAIKLDQGKHKSLEEGGCIMEMVSYLANEPWSDHPQCACPILTEYAIRMNDQFNDEHRQALKSLIPLLLDTKSTDEVQVARKRLIRWRNVTVTYPLILDLIGAKEIAEKLRSFGNNLEEMAKAKEFLNAKREEIRKIYYAYADANANANAYAYADAYADANAYAYANAYADANANAYAYANAYADADADAYADAYAYANANAYAYAYADALRKSIAAAAIETLRLAAEVKNG